MLLDYENITESNIVIRAFKLINDNKEEINVATYHNKDEIFYIKILFFLNKSIFYNFEKDTKKYEY